MQLALPNDFSLRRIESSDYEKSYFVLLEQLTVAPQIPQSEFNEIIRAPNSEIIVIEYLPESRIVATARLNFERKLIRGGQKVCHFEEFVVDEKFRTRGFGKIILAWAKERAQQEGCYKLQGICSQEMVAYYEKNDFACKSLAFSKYFVN